MESIIVQAITFLVSFVSALLVSLIAVRYDRKKKREAEFRQILTSLHFELQTNKKIANSIISDLDIAIHEAQGNKTFIKALPRFRNVVWAFAKTSGFIFDSRISEELRDSLDELYMATEDINETIAGYERMKMQMTSKGKQAFLNNIRGMLSEVFFELHEETWKLLESAVKKLLD